MFILNDPAGSDDDPDSILFKCVSTQVMSSSMYFRAGTDVGVEYSEDVGSAHVYSYPIPALILGHVDSVQKSEAALQRTDSSE